VTNPSVSPNDAWADSTPDSLPASPWTAQQVSALAQRQPPLSPWAVVGLQAVVGGFFVLAWWVFGAKPEQQMRSALWGVAAVVVPHAVMAWGLRRLAVTAAQAFLIFMVWELVKVGLAVLILVMAAWWVRDLSWLAILLTLVACLKVHVWALWMLARPVQRTN
jgi:ATP synthase protein I